VIGFGLLFHRKWAAALFAVLLGGTGFWMGIMSVVRVPMPWLILNIGLWSQLNGKLCRKQRELFGEPRSGGVKQYVAAVVDAAGRTAQFFTGLGGDDLLFTPDTVESQMMACSPGVTNAVNSYLSTGQTSGLYTFGLSGLVAARAANPTQQFVGSFRWSITPGDGGLNISLTNTTSFKSLTYDRGPQWQRASVPTPMGNTHQTYNIFIPCK
jgi:hypothetical protein